MPQRANMYMKGDAKHFSILHIYYMLKCFRYVELNKIYY